MVISSLIRGHNNVTCHARCVVSPCKLKLSRLNAAFVSNTLRSVTSYQVEQQKWTSENRFETQLTNGRGVTWTPQCCTPAMRWTGRQRRPFPICQAQFALQVCCATTMQYWAPWECRELTWTKLASPLMYGDGQQQMANQILRMSYTEFIDVVTLTVTSYPADLT